MTVVMRKNTWSQVGFWVGIIAAVIAAAWVGQHRELSEAWIRQAGWWGPLVAICLYCLLSFTPIPSDPLTLISGTLYGWNAAVIISFIGNTAAALVEYVVFRDMRTVIHFNVALLPRSLQKWPVTSPWFLIGVRLVPGFGGKVVSMMAGMYKVPWWRFLWTAAIANLIGAILWALGGWGLVKLF